MYRTTPIAIIMILAWQLSMAHTCPDIHAIKHNQPSGWKAYDSDDGTPLSPRLNAQFKANATQFVLAEWTKEGAIHCYYRDKNGSNLEAYLAKKHFLPENSQAYWYPVSGFMHCAASSEKCQFHASQQQLAKK
jgi:hypothetical protein